MSDIASRHAGTLGGRIEPLGRTTLAVGVEVEPGAVGQRAVQLTTWMLVNLLARLEGIVTDIVVGGGDAPLHANVVPSQTDADSLVSAVIDGITEIAAAAVHVGDPTQADVVLRVGAGGAPPTGWRVHGEGFCGAISRDGIASLRPSVLPFGPHIAACLAAGEVFRLARLPQADYTPTTGISYSLWDYTSGTGNLHTLGPELAPPRLDFGMAGVGAVGCAVMHTLWAWPELTGHAVIADHDPAGVDTTNLNRCVIFDRRHIGQPKATTAATICTDTGITWEPVDDRYARSALPRVPPMLVSAVDTNRSRNDLQQGFWPGRLLAASTHDLRAEVTRLGPPGQGPCLRCHNPPETDLPDDVRREQLRAMDTEELAAFASTIGHPVQLVRRWATDGGCGEVADAALAGLRAQDQELPAMFSVGFVSVLAGVMLAAEIVKEHAGREMPLDDALQDAKFQFVRPDAARNGQPRPQRRDNHCPACPPDGAGTSTWRQRADAWRPGQ